MHRFYLGVILFIVIFGWPAAAQTPADPVISRLVLRPSPASQVSIRTVEARTSDNAVLKVDLYVPVRSPRPTRAIIFVSGTDDARAWPGYRDLGRLADPLTVPVFDPSIRGHTSQFVLKFRKPLR